MRVSTEFRGDDRSATFTSGGPDKVIGTSDDAVCIAKGVREWDESYDTVLFNYSTAFVLPEGLDDAVAPHRVHKFAVGSARTPADVKYVKLIE
jgi:hypothetical protein